MIRKLFNIDIWKKKSKRFSLTEIEVKALFSVLYHESPTGIDLFMNKCESCLSERDPFFVKSQIESIYLSKEQSDKNRKQYYMNIDQAVDGKKATCVEANDRSVKIEDHLRKDKVWVAKISDELEIPEKAVNYYIGLYSQNLFNERAILFNSLDKIKPDFEKWIVEKFKKDQKEIKKWIK